MRSRLAVVVFFKVKSESKRSPGTNFAAEDMKENIRAMFTYIASNFESNTDKMFEYESNIRPMRSDNVPLTYYGVDSFQDHCKGLKLILKCKIGLNVSEMVLVAKREKYRY